MAKQKKEEECVQKVAEYMLTYGDMMTLLLCFFVLLFAFSSVDAKKFEGIIQSLSGSLGVLDSGNVIQSSKTIIESGNSPDNELLENVENVETEEQEIENFEKLEEAIQEYIFENNLDNEVTLLNEDAGLLLRFQDNVLFQPGSADVRGEALIILSYIADLLNGEQFKEKHINVEGHTDDVPMNSERFPSNWELSVTRASNVVRFLVENNNISPNRISASGYSEYRPIVPNDSAENRSQNRRVDILILKTHQNR